LSSASSDALFAATPFGDSITAADIVENLGFFDEWEERYRYIIDLGKQLPAFPPELQTEDRLVRGCQSQLWLEVGFDAQSGKVLLAADSDAIIVRGLIGIVFAALNRKTPAELRDYDMAGYFASLDLLKHLSPTRGNGLRSMVDRIRQETLRFPSN
jgi:cysteine desulfuration protein SufE